jgi:hypothetical protein
MKCVLKEKLLYQNLNMIFEFINSSVNQWVNWFIGDALVVRPPTRAGAGTSNTTGRCLTLIIC